MLISLKNEKSGEYERELNPEVTTEMQLDIYQGT
jgi:hypothetical protein